MSVDVPEVSSFSSKQYHTPEYKIAFIEVEATDGSGLELTQGNILPFFEEFKEFVDEMGTGQTTVNSNYAVLQKNVTGMDSSTLSNNIDAIADQLNDKYKNQYPGYNLVLIVDGTIGASGYNLDTGQEMHPVVLALGNFIETENPSDSSLTPFSYVFVHELLHSCNSGKIILPDANSNCLDEIPKCKYIPYGVMGELVTTHASAFCKVKAGWKNFEILNAPLNQQISIQIDNSCLSTTKIKKVPLGYEIIDNQLMLKSMILELRGGNECKYDTIPGTYGVLLYQTYEDTDILKYIYPLPPTDPPNRFGIGKTESYSGDDFDFTIISEDWRGSYIDSSHATLKIKQKSDDASIVGSSINTEIYNYNDEILVLKVDSTYTGYRYRIYVTSNIYILGTTDSQNSRFKCLFKPTFSGDKTTICRNLVEEIFGVQSSYINTYSFDLSEYSNLNLMLTNQINEDSLTITNFLK